MTDAALQAQTDSKGFRGTAQPCNVDISDISRLPGAQNDLQLARKRSRRFERMDRPPNVRHQLVDHKLGLASDAINDVVDADGVGDVMNEINEPADANRRERHGACDSHDRREGLRQCAGGGQGRDAIGKGPEENAERPLRHVIAYEAD